MFRLVERDILASAEVGLSLQQFLLHRRHQTNNILPKCADFVNSHNLLEERGPVSSSGDESDGRDFMLSKVRISFVDDGYELLWCK